MIVSIEFDSLESYIPLLLVVVAAMLGYDDKKQQLNKLVWIATAIELVYFIVVAAFVLFFGSITGVAVTSFGFPEGGAIIWLMILLVVFVIAVIGAIAWGINWLLAQLGWMIGKALRS